MQISPRHLLKLITVLTVAMAITTGGPAASAQAPDFVDVPPSHPFYSEVDWAGTHGIARGYGDNTFRPTTTVTRQEAVAFLHRLWVRLGGTPEPLQDPSFIDVSTGDPFYDDIAWAASLGITSGFGDGTFRPTGPVTRQAMMAFMHRLGVGPRPDRPRPDRRPGIRRRTGRPSVLQRHRMGCRTRVRQRLQRCHIQANDIGHTPSRRRLPLPHGPDTRRLVVGRHN